VDEPESSDSQAERVGERRKEANFKGTGVQGWAQAALVTRESSGPVSTLQQQRGYSACDCEH
jgi:hypothetical protein